MPSELHDSYALPGLQNKQQSHGLELQHETCEKHLFMFYISIICNPLTRDPLSYRTLLMESKRSTDSNQLYPQHIILSKQYSREMNDVNLPEIKS